MACKVRRNSTIALAALAWAVSNSTSFAVDIGLSQFRGETNNAYLGQGVVVLQAEAPVVENTLSFEINAQLAGITVPLTFVYLNGSTITNTPTFNAAYHSDHADVVAMNLAGTTSGVAPGLTGIQNYDAVLFVNHYVLQNLTVGSARVINQSFTETPDDTFTTPILDQFFDNYVYVRQYIMVTAAGNGGDVQPPGTAYNVICVGAYQGATSISQPGQRSKPDIVAPAAFTSFATPIVSGAAALLVQVAGSGHGTDPRIVKALLLNGATKPSDWTHSSAVPLDRTYGAGVVNIDTSYHNLVAGEHAASATTSTSGLGGSHLPVNSSNVSTAGWNLNAISSLPNSDRVDHYVIDLTQSNAIVTLTATLTWQRANDAALTQEYLANANNTNFHTFTTSVLTINNLDMYLYNVTTQQQVDLSNSAIDSVEHLYTLNLTPGKYDLQVLKNGGMPGTANVFSNSETYGLAWNTGSQSMVTNTGNLAFNQTNNVLITAPITGSGTLNISGTGTTTLTNYQGTGPIAIASGALALGTTVAPRHTPAVLTQASALTIASGSTLDLTNHDLLVHSGSTSNLEAKIGAAYFFGLWNHPGITSSAAQASSITTLGIMSGANYNLFSPTPGVFDGVPVADTDIVIKFTYVGDLNLDGLVNDDDFGLFSTAYFFTGKGNYATGDLNFDGLVNDDDFGLFSTSYFFPPGTPLDSGLGLTGLLSGPAAAPEPASVAVLLLGIWPLLRRRRRREPSP